MNVRTCALIAILGIGLTTLAGCATGPTDRRQVCDAFDQLGTDVLEANGLIDNRVFDQADTLADLAGRYPGSPNLDTDAAMLHKIAGSDQTDGLELTNATTEIAELCGHELGLGTTYYGNSGNSYNAAGNPGATTNYAAPSTGGWWNDPGQNNVAPNYPEPTSTAPAGTVTDESSAQAALQQEVDNDRSAVDQLAGSWVPQLSSKTYGLVVNGDQYDYQQIWNDFAGIREIHPEALLLWSGDYSSFTLANYWVTIVGTPFTDAAQANAWCDSENLPADGCFAKLISHTAAAAGSTKPR